VTESDLREPGEREIKFGASCGDAIRKRTGTRDQDLQGPEAEFNACLSRHPAFKAYCKR